jgi:hypothetical protein
LPYSWHARGYPLVSSSALRALHVSAPRPRLLVSRSAPHASRPAV